MKILTIFLISMAFAVEAMNVSQIDWKPAKPEDLPYYATIRANARGGKTKRICAGAIISEFSVLTSAHCGEVCLHPKNCHIFIGRTQACSGGQEVKILEIILHNPHDLKKGVDISIFRTESIQFDDNSIKPIKIADKDLTEKTDVIIARWNHPQSTVTFNHF